MRLKESDGSIFSQIEEKPEITKTIKTEVIVIGAGVIGATVARNFRNRGHEVILIDDNDPESGSKPCGGLVKPSPLMGLPNDEIKECMDVLNSTYEMKLEPILIRPSGNMIKVGVFELNMDDIFETEQTLGHVFEINTDPIEVSVSHPKRKGAKLYKGKILVVAAGMGCRLLFAEMFRKDGLVAKRGFSFHFDGQVDHSFVKFWAPYKQITIHNSMYQGQKILWGGDGSALTLPSWYDGRIEEALVRVRGEIGEEMPLLRTIRGLRSFHRNKKYKPCYLDKFAPNCWLATGSGKFGLISAGYVTKEILKDELD